MVVEVCLQKITKEMLDYTPVLINSFELIASLIATYMVAIKKVGSKTENYFLIFLWITFLCDSLGTFFGYVLETEENYIVLNIYTIISIPFLLFWYRALQKNKILKATTLFFIIIFLIFIIYNILYLEFKSEYLSILFLFGAIFLVISICFYFIEQLFSDTVFKVKHNMVFWISLGQIIFYLGMIPMISLNKYIMPFLKIDPVIYFVILLVLNIILYTSYILAFLWNEKK